MTTGFDGYTIIVSSRDRGTGSVHSVLRRGQVKVNIRMNLVKSIGIVVGIIPILLIGPTICAASMDMTTMAHDSGSHMDGAAVPQCVSTLVNPHSHHLLMNAVGEEVKPSSLIPSEAVCISWSPADLTVEPSPTEGKPVQTDVRDHTPLPKPIAYHCRNFLSSEEPPL